MKNMHELVTNIEYDIELSELSFSQIATKYSVSISDIDIIWSQMRDRMEYEEDTEYHDADSWYDEQYEYSDY